MRRAGVAWRPNPRPVRRLSQLYAGLVLYGFSDGLLVLAALGLDPWDVFHQGLARRTGIEIGTWSIIVGAAVLVLWIPLRQWPGLGTASNVVVIGLVVNLTLAEVPVPHHLPMRILLLVGGVVLNGMATGCYIGAGLGPGPRDGLMTGLVARRGGSIRLIRTGIELTVLAVGWLLGGTVGIGTVVYAAGIGPLAHLFIPLFSRGLQRNAVGDTTQAPNHSSHPNRSHPNRSHPNRSHPNRSSDTEMETVPCVDS